MLQKKTVNTIFILKNHKESAVNAIKKDVTMSH